MTDARVREFSLALESPLATAGGSIDARDGFLLRVEDGDEAGVGEATPLPGWTESVAACRESLDAAADALSADGVDAAVADLGPAARHGVSLARADLRARRAGDPLYRHLGSETSASRAGSAGRREAPPDERAADAASKATREARKVVESVPVNATVGDADAETTAARAVEAADAGFDCVKVKVGARPVAEDAARLEAVRDAVGPGVELRADANASWARDEARRAFERFADADVAFVEQPLAPDDLRGHADLRGGSVGVALDESLAHVPLADVLAADAADALVLKPMVLGGVAAARDVALRARDAGVTPVVTTTIDGVVARTAAVHLAASLPDVPACGLATAGFLADDLADDPAPVSEGRIAVPQADGHGAGAAWEGVR
jgi:o-succinylbenzoate synthase